LVGGRSVGRSRGSHTNVTLPLQFCHTGPPFPTLLRPVGHPQNGLKFWLIDRSVGHGEVSQTSCCLFSFVTRAHPFRPFYALWTTPKTALNFGWSVGRSVGRLVGWSVSQSVGQSRGSHTNVMLPLQFLNPGLPFPTLLRPAGHPQNGLKFWSVGRSWGSHMNVTLPLQFRQPGLTFPTLLCPAGHPQNGLKFWSGGRSRGQSVGWSVGHREVTRTSRCFFSFITRACPSRPFYALRATPKMALNFGWSVGGSVGRSRGSHTNVTLPLQFCHPGPFFPTLLRPAGHPQNGLKFWLIGRLVGPALPDPSTPCGPPPKRP
jgi:hypothetical protein